MALLHGGRIQLGTVKAPHINHDKRIGLLTMAVSDKDFNEIESAVDRLFDSELTEQQRKDVTTMMRVAYRHIHKANNQVFESQRLAEEAIESFNRLEFYYAPVTSATQWRS